MPKTILDLQALARLGAKMSVDANERTNTDLQSLARIVNDHEGSLTIRNADSKSVLDLQAIVRLAPGKIFLDL